MPAVKPSDIKSPESKKSGVPHVRQFLKKHQIPYDISDIIT